MFIWRLCLSGRCDACTNYVPRASDDAPLTPCLPIHVYGFPCALFPYASYGELGARIVGGQLTTFTEMPFASFLCSSASPALGVVSAHAGNECTYLLCSDGSLYSVGLNKKGQAGVGTTSEAVTPPCRVPVPVRCCCCCCCGVSFCLFSLLHSAGK